MFKIGCHLSISKGFANVVKSAINIDANTFQFFLRNPRGGQIKKINKSDMDLCKYLLNFNNFSQIVVHAPYILNLCSNNGYIRQISQKNLWQDLLIMEKYFPNNYYNFHPGSYTTQSKKIGILQISEALNKIIEPNLTSTILLETMVGKGSEIGGTFEDLKEIIDQIDIKEKIGVCFDTCHVYDAGYDIAENFDSVLRIFNEIIGINNLKVIHVNNSKNKLGSKKDRHEKINSGKIPLEFFKKLINHEMLKDLVFILETPQDNLEGYAEEIAWFKTKFKQQA